MKRHSYLLLGVLVVAALVLGACKGSSTPEPAEVTGLLNGMNADELEAAGYVVVAPGEPVRVILMPLEAYLAMTMNSIYKTELAMVMQQP